MTCQDAKILMLFSRANGAADLLPEDVATLQQHFQACPNCAAIAASNRAWDRSVAQQLQAVSVPVGLQSQLLKSAYAHQGAVLRKRVYLSFAAMLLVAILGMAAYTTYLLTRPRFDTNLVLDQFQNELEQPEQATKNWLSAQSLPQHLPEPFDFRLLTARGMVSLQGQLAPCLTFQVWRPGEIRPDTARVFVVTREQFKLQTLREGQNSFGTVRIILDETQGVAYVIIHTASLELFLKPNFRQVTRL